MSRLSKKPIIIPDGVNILLKDGVLEVTGKNGTLKRDLPQDILVAIQDKEIRVSLKENAENKALCGTYVSHIKNMIKGVVTPFEKKMQIEGVGFKADVKGDEIVLNIGFSHPVKIKIPKEIKVVSDKNGISVSGIDIEKVGQFASYVRSQKKPEPYQGKGIRYNDEIVRRKQGKKTV